MFDDLFIVAMTAVIDVIRSVRRSDDCLSFLRPLRLGTRRIRPKNVIIRVLFSNNLNVPIGPSCGYVIWVPPLSYFDAPCAIQRPTLTLDRLFDE